MAEGPRHDEPGRLRQHVREHGLRRELGAGVGVERSRDHRLMRRAFAEARPIDVRRRGEDHDGLGRMTRERRGQIAGADEIDPPGLLRGGEGFRRRGLSGEMDDEILAAFRRSSPRQPLDRGDRRPSSPSRARDWPRPPERATCVARMDRRAPEPRAYSARRSRSRRSPICVRNGPRNGTPLPRSSCCGFPLQTRRDRRRAFRGSGPRARSSPPSRVSLCALAGSPSRMSTSAGR